MFIKFITRKTSDTVALLLIYMLKLFKLQTDVSATDSATQTTLTPVITFYPLHRMD